MRLMPKIVLVAAASSLLLTNVAHARQQETGEERGRAHFVSAMEADMATLLDDLGLEATAEPTSHGIPPRLEAIGANATYVGDTISAQLEDVLFAVEEASRSALLEGVPLSDEEGIRFSGLIQEINSAAFQLQDWLALQMQREATNIGDMFEMQMLMNTLSQLSERTTAIISVANEAIVSMARNIRG